MTESASTLNLSLEVTVLELRDVSKRYGAVPALGRALFNASEFLYVP